MQMDWKTGKKADETSNFINPDDIWTIEGPTRKAQDMARTQKRVEEMKKTLNTQAQFYKTNLQNERYTDLIEGKKHCEEDALMKD